MRISEGMNSEGVKRSTAKTRRPVHQPVHQPARRTFRILGALFGLTMLAALHQHVSAQSAPQPPSASLQAPASLRVGDRARITLRLRHLGERPLLVTPSVEGDALEVVRGRLTRNDGQSDADGLEIPIPVVARHAGHALLVAHVQTFVCDRGNCQAVRLRAEAELEVRR